MLVDIIHIMYFCGTYVLIYINMCLKLEQMQVRIVGFFWRNFHPSNPEILMLNFSQP